MLASIVPRVELSIGGSTRLLRCDFQALWLIERTSGEPAHVVCRRIHQAFTERKQPRMADVRRVLWAMLASADESLKERQVGAWGSAQNMPTLVKAIFEAISAAAPMPTDDEPSESAPSTEKPKATNWAEMFATARRHYGIRTEAKFWRLTWREWSAMTEIHQQDEDRKDWRNALALACAANRRRDPMKNPIAFEPWDFMQRGAMLKKRIKRDPWQPKQNYEQMKARLLMAAQKSRAFFDAHPESVELPKQTIQ